MNEWSDFTREVVAGDSLIFRYQITDTAGTPINIGAGGPFGLWSNFWHTAKYRSADADLAAVYQRTYSPVAGITIVNAATGLLEIEILPASTAALLAIRRTLALVADVQGKDGNGRIWTSKRGLILVKPAATVAA